jgi:hypothetical protein
MALDLVNSSTMGKDPKADRVGLLVGLSRTELFAGLCILGFANGIVGRVQGAVMSDGAVTALVNTFSISAVVWVAFFVCPALLLRAPREPLVRADLIVAACALGAFILPLGPLTWVVLTGLALYILRDSFALRGRKPLSPAHRAAWILLATTGPMFWGRLLLHSASGPVLGADALLISWLAGTERVGNTVRFADGAGYIWIAPACSSLTNVSLAILCWVLFAQSRGLRWSFGNAGWCLLACLSVVAINITRISLMVLHREHFDLIHGPTGDTVAGWLSIAVMLGVCAFGTRHGRLTDA